MLLQSVMFSLQILQHDIVPHEVRTLNLSHREFKNHTKSISWFKVMFLFCDTVAAILDHMPLCGWRWSHLLVCVSLKSTTD